MIEEAFISGQLGKAIYADSGRYFVLSIDDQIGPVECRPMDVSAFFDFGADLKALPARQLTLARLRAELADQRRARQALTLIISGMDDELDDDTRSAAVERAERLVEGEDSARRFVRARMFARPLPSGADIQNALDIAIRTNATTVGILYQNILDYEQAITIVHEAWSEAASHYCSSNEGQLEGEDMLTDLGAFAEMVTAVATGNINALNSVVVTYGQKPELNRVFGRATVILNDLRTRLAKKLHSTSSTPKKGDRQMRGEPDEVITDAGSMRDVLASFKNRRENPRSRVFTADEAKEKVDHQIEAISKLILQDDINRANSYLGDLISFHVEHSEREHLGMSLCSLAKVAIDARSFEIAERMVDYALLLGIDDVVISTTQAQVFKSMGDFDKALVVYEETMARFPNDVVVHGGYAEVLKSMGDFDKALVVYEETMASFPNDVVVRNGYAEVLKSMGDFGKALVVHEETMARFPNNEVVRNGFASILILTNRFDAARSLLSDSRLKTKQDWIDYHVIAMSYIRSEEIDEAIRRLAYGLENTPWIEEKNYFATALAVAKIRKKEFAEVLEILPTNVVNIDVFQRQTRLALVGHSQAALGKNEEAAQTLAKLNDATNPHVINLKEAISRRYMLGQQSHATLSVTEERTLDARILEQEYFLAMAA